MYLTIEEQTKADKLRIYIESNLNGKFIKCLNCRGHGLSGVFKNSSLDFSWGGEFCTECKGVGYIEYIHDESKIVCSSCYGAGCESCKYKGVLDWAEAAILGITHFTDNK